MRKTNNIVLNEKITEKVNFKITPHQLIPTSLILIFSVRICVLEENRKLINITEVNNMLEMFLFNVTVGGIILSAGGLIGLELLENFNGKYKMSKKRNTVKKSKMSEKYGRVKIAKNSGKIDIRMSNSKNEVA